MEDLPKFGPVGAGCCVFDGQLHGVHDLPPALGLGIGGHAAHVGGVVGAVVLEVGEEQVTAQEDGVVADVAVGDGLEHTGPDLGMMTDIFRFVFWPEANDLCVALQTAPAFRYDRLQYLIRNKLHIEKLRDRDWRWKFASRKNRLPGLSFGGRRLHRTLTATHPVRLTDNVSTVRRSMTKRIGYGLFAAALLARGSAGVTQTTPSTAQNAPEYSLRVKVDEVVLTFHASDANGRPVNDLQLDELRLLEDGETTGTIVGLQSQQDLPVRAGLLLDTSASMQSHRVQDRLIAMDYARKAMRQTTDAAFVMNFGHSVTLMQPWTHDGEALALAAREIAPRVGTDGTGLFDAIFEACHGQFGGIDHAASGNFLLLFTDGEDNASFTTLQAAVDMCQRNSTAIYAFRAGGQDAGGSIGPATLARLTQETGGRVFPDDDPLERVDADLKTIDADLRNQYRLIYRPAALKHDGVFHPIVLLGPDRLANVTMRNGYYAPVH